MSNISHQFVIESTEIEGGRKLKVPKPDKDGYYDLPWAVLGAKSRNGITYDVEAFKQCILSPSARVNILLKEGSLHGEWGHPYTEDLKRVSEIFEDKISHHIKKLYTGETLSSGGTVLMAKVKPFGPYKEYLRESIEDPSINTSFSLRSICEQRIDYQTQEIYRKMKMFVTFDYVHGGGYKEASKRYSPSMENFAFEVKREDFFTDDGSTIAYEHYSDKDILDIFGAKEIMITTKTTALHLEGSSTLLDKNGNKSSILHTALSNFESL